MSRLDWRLGLARRSEGLDEFGRVAGRTIEVVGKIGQGDAKAFGGRGQKLAEEIEVARCAIGRQAHDFALAVVGAKTQVLRDGGVDRTDAVGKIDLRENLDVGAASPGDHRRGALAVAVNREDRRVREGGVEEGMGGVGEVVRDEVDMAGSALPGQREFEVGQGREVLGCLAGQELRREAIEILEVVAGRTNEAPVRRVHMTSGVPKEGDAVDIIEG